MAKESLQNYEIEVNCYLTYVHLAVTIIELSGYIQTETARADDGIRLTALIFNSVLYNVICEEVKILTAI